jgi:formyltetrahydrofolate deformylase
MTKILILIQCPDKIGIVATISRIIASHELNIIAMREFVDKDNTQFFARIECSGNNMDNDLIRKELEEALGHTARITITPFKSDKKVAVLVTKEYHCLGDILVKNFFGLLGADVSCVIGNHDILGPFTRQFSIPFYPISHLNKPKEQFERELLDVIASYQVDYIILAKFMRILSGDFIGEYPNRIINIHHSFLPAFIGANPYKQAFDRGVKVIGATAHFVTASLDDGPIISQETIHINHNYDTHQMKIRGREIERNVLNKAMDLVFNDRVFIVGNKTVIFE